MSKSSTIWGGQRELLELLQSLTSSSKPVPASKVKAVVECAVKNEREYKLVVYEIEKFLKKSNAKDRLPIIYVIDKLCRQSRERFGKEKDTFSTRFSIRLKDTCDCLNEIPLDDKRSLKRVLDEWSKREIFPHNTLAAISDTVLDEIGGISQDHNSSSSPDPGLVTFDTPSINPQYVPMATSLPSAPVQIPLSSQPSFGSLPVDKPLDPRLKQKLAAAAAVAASSAGASISGSIVPASDVAAVGAKPSQPSRSVGSRQLAKLCPFRINEGSDCPFGRSCRFTHSEWSYLQSPALHAITHMSSTLTSEVTAAQSESLVEQAFYDRIEHAWLTQPNIIIPSLNDVTTTTVFPVLYRRVGANASSVFSTPLSSVPSDTLGTTASSSASSSASSATTAAGVKRKAYTAYPDMMLMPPNNKLQIWTLPRAEFMQRIGVPGAASVS